VQIERSERRLAVSVGRDLREGGARGQRFANLAFQPSELFAGVLPVFQRYPRVDRREQVHERLVLSEGLHVELVV